MTITRITLTGVEIQEHWLRRDEFKRELIKDSNSWVMSNDIKVHYVPIWLMPATLLLGRKPCIAAEGISDATALAM